MTFDEKTTISFSKWHMDRIAKATEAWERFAETGWDEDYKAWQDLAEEIAIYVQQKVKDLPF